MIFRSLLLLTLVCASLFVSRASAQEHRPGMGPGGPADKDAAPPLGVDKFYFDLTKSDDRALRSMAERYVGLVKIQEWSDLTGKFKAVAHYVKHDPNMTTVTIAIMKGQGTDRSSEEKTVPVDKLSKTCQSRVKQIDTMQKKLKEMAAKPGQNGVPGGPGAPMSDEHGADPGPGASPPGSPPSSAAVDPSASEPDPLGFAEVQLVVAGPPAGPGAVVPGPPPGGAPQPNSLDTGPGSLPPGPPAGRPGAR
ncbi:MAG TPA: hypothetical protein VHU84_06350 [Lacipirellulaceae bacterium]|nr:hypothetical protein [Lacipirellulaceae bacterium]